MTWKLVREDLVPKLTETELEGDLRYDPSQHALCLAGPEGDGEVLTVDLLASGYVAMLGEVFVRDYSEHSGLPAALVAAGVCGEVEKLSVGPFSSSVSRMRVIAAG